jgi:hypothetical protein
MQDSCAISQSYAVVAAKGVTSVGGLVGNQYGPQTSIATSFAAGSVVATGGLNAGGFVGANTSGAISGCFFDITLAGIPQGIGSGTGFVTARTTAQMKANTAGYGAFDFNTTWTLVNGQTYPFFKHQAAPTLFSGTPMVDLFTVTLNAAEYANTDSLAFFKKRTQIASYRSVNGAVTYTSSFPYLSVEAADTIKLLTFAKGKQPSYFVEGIVGAYFTAGTGTRGDPYIVSTAKQLDMLRYFVDAKHADTYFKLSASIDLNAHLYIDPFTDKNPAGTGVAAWDPIGTAAHPFQAHVDGNSFMVYNLRVHRPALSNVGLFGYLKNAEISNLFVEGLAADSIDGKNNVGILAGYAEGATLTNVRAGGRASAVDTVAVIVGYAKSTTITSSHALGVATAAGANAGGIAGVATGVTLTGSYAAVSVRAADNAGGLVGHQRGGVTAATYALGSVSATATAGGLVGTLDAGAVQQSYATGAVAGGTIGGIVGANAGTSTNCYFDATTTGQSTGAGTGGNGGNGLSTAQLQSGATYMSGWDFGATWTFVDGKTYPYFPRQSAPLTPTAATITGFTVAFLPGTFASAGTIQLFTYGTQVALFANIVQTSQSTYTGAVASGTLSTGAPVNVVAVELGKQPSYPNAHPVTQTLFTQGSGTATDPYLVTNAAELSAVRNFSGAANKGVCFKQTADINLLPYLQQGGAGYAAWTTAGWLPIPTFSGTYDGNGKKITGLWIHRSTTNTVGLFAGLDEIGRAHV